MGAKEQGQAGDKSGIKKYILSQYQRSLYTKGNYRNIKLKYVSKETRVVGKSPGEFGDINST
jgi:hypothetical protein